MDNLFDHFTIVYELAKYIDWNDIHSFKRINLLCNEVCEREMRRRCKGIMNGYLSISQINKTSKAKRQRCANLEENELRAQMQYHNPSLVLICSNKKGTLGIEDIVSRQCSSNSLICRLYSNRGCLGVSKSAMVMATSARKGGIWWLSLPEEADVCLVTKDNDIMSNTKIVLVFNASVSTNVYPSSVFNDDERVSSNPVIYCGGLVPVIELYNNEKGVFERVEHVCIAIGGEDVRVDYVVMDESYVEAESIRREFTTLKETNARYVRDKHMRHQCVLVFSCYFRNTATYGDAVELAAEGQRKTEFDLFYEYFPDVPMQGVFCEGEIFHVHHGVVRLLKSLEAGDIDGVTSIYVLLTWAK